MKTIKLSAVMASMLAAGSLLLTVPAVSNASSPGQGWDAFNSGASNEGVGEPILVSGKLYLGTSLESVTTGQGWDAFNSGASHEGVGEPIPMASKAYRGTALEVAPSLDSDAFRTGYQ